MGFAAPDPSDKRGDSCIASMIEVESSADQSISDIEGLASGTLSSTFITAVIATIALESTSAS